ncbi:nuclear transport factor 2 family protein [Nocardiopsis sp. HNM0947]|uniref:Nuclear transport factor 2 family protein n=1 Tax=Nocardiopsis coralli TaxID=2772213 RepID=A0ABR9P2L6_9ACTN|nr:nuclear transport factor 2 family protein [Nocardiopsis coralli]MBE2998082.1 nuclear transport factor 2 family protein [Nocardiopsis coralli]
MTALATTAEQDRTELLDLLARFVHCLDRRDFEGYAALFTQDCRLSLPHAAHHGRAGLAAFVAADLGGYAATHHSTSDHLVRIEGDTATVRSQMRAVHLRSAQDPKDWWAVGGRYEHAFRREAGGWAISAVTVTPVWMDEGS